MNFLNFRCFLNLVSIYPNFLKYLSTKSRTTVDNKNKNNNNNKNSSLDTRPELMIHDNASTRPCGLREAIK